MVEPTKNPGRSGGQGCRGQVPGSRRSDPAWMRIASRLLRCEGFGMARRIISPRLPQNWRTHIMKPIVRAAPLLLSAFAIALAFPVTADEKVKPPATYKELPSEIPDKFKPVTDR